MSELGDQFESEGAATRGASRESRAAAIARLRDMISSDAYVPGDRLPAERELIVQFGVTRATLRRALETLEAEGLIWRHVGKGTFVASQSENAALGGLHDLAKQITPIKMMRARISIEPAIAREAAMNASSEALSRINLAKERAQHAPTWEEYEAQDDLMHRQIAAATDNPLLLSLFDHLNQVRRAVAWGAVVRTSVRPDSQHSSFEEHDKIAAAIAARDPVAAQDAMRRHLGSVASRLFGES